MKAFMPEGIRIYEDKEKGEYAFEIINKPNRFVPRYVKSYKNKKVAVFEMANEKQMNLQNR